MPRFQISSELPVRLVDDGVRPVFVKKQLVVALFLPGAATVYIPPAGVDHIFRVAALFLLIIDCVGQRPPGVGFALAKTCREQVPILFSAVNAHITPHSCEEVGASYGVFGKDRGFLYFAAREGIQRAADLFVSVVLRRSQNFQIVVTGQKRLVHERDYGLLRSAVQDREFLHPLVQILAHGGVANAGIQIAGLERLHSGHALLRGFAPNPVEQFV